MPIISATFCRLSSTVLALASLTVAAGSARGNEGTLIAVQDSVWERVYSDEQARRGEQQYKTSCSYCHRDDLSGGFFDDGTGRAPALAGPRAFNSSFAERWNDASLAEILATIVSTMPQNKPTSLSLPVYVDILTYLLSKNDIPSGPRELSTDLETLQQIIVTPKP
jgi:cytochrome c